MPKFFQRRVPTTTATTTTPLKSTPPSRRTAAADVQDTPPTVDLSRYETPRNHQDNQDQQDDEDDHEPWDVIQASFSDDGGGSEAANSNTTPTSLMRQTIQQRMKNRLRYDNNDNNDNGDEEVVLPTAGAADADALQTTIPPKVLRETHRSIRPLSPPAAMAVGGGTAASSYSPPTIGSSRDTEDQRDLAEGDLEDMPEDEKEQYLQALGLCGFAESGTAMVRGDYNDDMNNNNNNNNLCDYTLTTLGEFCGVGPSSYEEDSALPHNKKPDPTGRAALTKSLPLLKPPYGVEEQTAIEVEYIEPDRRQDVKSDASTTPRADSQQTKNRLVQAMARRAKLDFETKKGKPATVSSPTPVEDTGTTKDAPSNSSNSSMTPDNIYSSFSSSEKRMFLKLINSGLTPSDATAQVLQERDDAAAVAAAAAAHGEEDTSAGQTPFWKTTAPRDAMEQNASSPVVREEHIQGSRGGEEPYEGAAHLAANGGEQEDDDDELSGLGQTSPKNRIAATKLATFGLGRSNKSQPHGGDQENMEHPIEKLQSAARDPPPAELLPTDRPTPTSPPVPINTARNFPSEELLEAVAESRSIFKPISPRSPDPEEETGHERGVVERALPSSMSEDSLLDDEDAAQPEIEPEIVVVPSASETSFTASEDEEQQMESSEQREEAIVAARLLGPPRHAAVQASPPRTMITEGLDLDVDTAYMNSTELMSQYNGNSLMGDHHTVRTQGTYNTTGTNYTTSTRSRRPGASKQRLTSQKTGESGTSSAHKYKGWQVSIQEAAAGIGKVWDPVKGWVGYKEAEDEKKDDTFDSLPPAEHRSIATIPEYASASSASAPEQATASSVSSPEQAAASSVSSPDSLAVLEEKDMPEVHHSRMLEGPPRHGTVTSTRESTTPVKDSLPVLGDKVIPQVHRTRTPEGPPRPGAASSKKAVTTPVRSRGWMETMKEATAKLAGQGKRWDPDRGWVGPNDDSDSALESGRYRSAGVEGQVESDTQDFGTIQVTGDAIEPTTVQHVVPREPSGQKPIHNLRLDPVGELPQYQQQIEETLSDHQSVDTSLKSAATGRYIQLGDTGSVSSFYQGNPSNKTTPSKDRMATLESTPESKDEDDASSSQQPQSTLLVNVKKEKVDPSEAKMFPEISQSSRGAPRSTGPVDLDDEEDENAIFADAPGFSWDEDDFGNSSETKKKPPSDGKSVSTVSTIPRLPAPKRDTSPIRGRGPSANKASPQQLLVPGVTAQQVTPSPGQKERATAPSGSPSTPITSMKNQSNPVALVTPTSAAQPAGHGPDRSLKKFPVPTKDTVTPPASSSSVNQVRELHQYWEKRSVDKPITPPSAEWKSFLSKKVMAENSAVESRNRPSATGEDDRDTLFDFGSESAYSAAKHVQGATTTRNTDLGLRQLEQISNLSPIRTVHDDDEDDDDMNAPSEVSTEVLQGKTFMERIQACAAPILPRQLEGVNCNPMPLAHLNFMRRNQPVAPSNDSQHSRSGPVVAPKSLYGKPDVIVEEEEEEDSAEDGQLARTPKGPSPSKGRGDVSSVISDEQFGQKTAYLEAIAMKAAVSGSKKPRRTRSSGSESSGNIKHSESWQRFLDKKNAATSEDQESVQRAAEEYAAKKIDQMIARKQPAEFDSRPMEEATGAFPSVKNVNRFKGDTEWKTESTRAAEDLAAARVEAMMHSLSTKRPLDEDEGEI